MGIGGGVVCLSALALLLDGCQTTVEHIVCALPLPSVLQVPLAYVGLIQESVVVHVVMAEVVLIMRQYLCAQLVVEVDVGIGIGLQTAQGAAIEVHRHSLVTVWFQILDVYLSRDALIAVTHRRRALRHLDAVHPRAGDVVERVGGCRPTEVWQVLGEHLHVGTAQSQELDLLGARGGVAIVHVDAGIRGKALAQVTAGCLEQFLTAYQYGVGRSPHASRSCPSRGDGHVRQADCFVGHRVCLQRVICLSES